MKILVTNDDGFGAKGLSVLVDILKSYGDITVVAPKRPQSGMSMAISMGLKPLAARKVSEIPGVAWWYLDGTPASCIKFGLDNVLYPERPDLVVSGINHGSNAATASVYSGTIGGAMEGALNGIPAIGVSLDNLSKDADFSAVARLLPGILDKMIPNMNGRHGSFYNINFPDLPAEEVRGVRVCHMGKAHWEKEYRPYAEFLASSGREPGKEYLEYLAAAEPGEEIYVMAGDFTDDGTNVFPADHQLLHEGYITITPQNIDNTDYAEVGRMSEFFGQ